MNEQPEAMQLPTLPFAVFDEFGQPCENRVRDYFAAAFEELLSQIGQWGPDGVLDVLDNFEKKERSPFQAYLAAGLVNELRTAMLASAPQAPQQKPLTDEQIEQISQQIERSDFFDCVIPFARAIEAAHNIGGGQP